MKDAKDGQNPNSVVTAPNPSGWTRLVRHMKRYLHERKAEKEKESPADRAARRTATATVWIAVFTVVLAFVGIITLIEVLSGGSDTHTLAVATKKQADAFILSQRAFVTFSPDATINTEIGPNRKVISWQVRVPMKNDSPTATRGLQDCPSVANVPWGPLPQSFQYPNACEPFAAPLGPKGQISAIPKNIPIADIQAVQRKERSIYVYGWATYRDVFPSSPKHVTLFCYELVLNTIGGDLTDMNYNRAGTLLLCPHHNCQDEDCAREVLPRGFQAN